MQDALKKWIIRRVDERKGVRNPDLRVISRQMMGNIMTYPSLSLKAVQKQRYDGNKL